MASHALAAKLPVRVAREALRQLRGQPRESGNRVSFELVVSSTLMKALHGCDASEAFRYEIRDLIGAVTDSEVELQMSADETFNPADVALSPMEPTDAMSSDGPPEPSDPPTSANFTTGDQRLLLRHGTLNYEVTGVVTLGRSSSSTIIIDDSEASRSHAEVSIVDHELVVRDLSSTNGTKVNGRIIDAPTALTPGDVILIGNTEISVVSS
jgi:hypothetical protein